MTTKGLRDDGGKQRATSLVTGRRGHPGRGAVDEAMGGRRELGS